MQRVYHTALHVPYVRANRQGEHKTQFHPKVVIKKNGNIAFTNYAF